MFDSTNPAVPGPGSCIMQRPQEAVSPKSLRQAATPQAAHQVKSVMSWQVVFKTAFRQAARTQRWRRKAFEAGAECSYVSKCCLLLWSVRGFCTLVFGLLFACKCRHGASVELAAAECSGLPESGHSQLHEAAHCRAVRQPRQAYLAQRHHGAAGRGVPCGRHSCW